jgi:HD-GYP domain-containing protein (c-di-GMP phosphodiesterase class II)
MRKKVKVVDLQLGMFVDELCGSWMDHPFWKTAFKLANQKDLQTLRESNVMEVWIDTSKGLDIQTMAKVVSENEEKLKTDALLQQAASKESVAEARISLNQEINRARQIHAKARTAVMSMFKEARMGHAIEVAEVTTLVDDINQSVARNPGALISLARLKTKDDYTYLHSVAVCALMIGLGRTLGLTGDTLKSAGMAGLLHDVGKMMIPNAVLNKPGKLTDDEFTTIKSHPLRGWEILKESYGVDAIALDVCLHHHERVDGKGYPNKISGDDLTLFARMGAVCDVYDAITSDRCYKNAWAPGEAIRKMAEWKDGHFDEIIFQSFVKTVGIYPIGSLVKLRSGRLAVVTDQSERSLLLPKVKVFFSTKSQIHVPPEIIDLALAQDSIVETEDPAKWGFDMKKITGLWQS